MLHTNRASSMEDKECYERSLSGAGSKKSMSTLKMGWKDASSGTRDRECDMKNP
jgi:hypothetical protein